MQSMASRALSATECCTQLARMGQTGAPVQAGYPRSLLHVAVKASWSFDDVGVPSFEVRTSHEKQ